MITYANNKIIWEITLNILYSSAVKSNVGLSAFSTFPKDKKSHIISVYTYNPRIINECYDIMLLVKEKWI